MSQEFKSRVIDVKEVLKRETRNYMLYFNYDNEAFMNTGIQESGSTPFGASTTTGPSGKAVPGKVGIKQDIIDGIVDDIKTQTGCFRSGASTDISGNS